MQKLIRSTATSRKSLPLLFFMLAGNILCARAQIIDPGSITNPSQSVVFNSMAAQLQTTAATWTQQGIHRECFLTTSWQVSINGTDFSDIPNTLNQQNFQPGVLISTTWYRRKAQCLLGGSTAYTNIAAVTVTNLVFGVQAPDNTTGSPDAGMNWVITRQFDDNGVVTGESKEFFDTDGRLLQTQSKLKYRSDPNTVYTHVFASQPISDLYGRNALTTLGAPINSSEFGYKPDFVQNTYGYTYSYTDYDKYDPQAPPSMDKTNSPNPVGGQATKGTLGWYYGSQNIWEPYMATTNYPYTRQSYYSDGTGAAKKSTGVGEPFIMGSGHESKNYQTPVSGELAHYLQVRNKFFSTGTAGELPGDITGKAMQLVGSDANGKEAVIIADKDGRELVKGRPGNDLVVNDQVILAANGAYSATVTRNSRIKIDPQALVQVYSGGTLLYSGPYSIMGSTFGSLIFSIQLLSNTPFTVCNNFLCQSPTPAAGSTLQFYYFKILADNTPVTLTGDYLLYDMDQETAITLPASNTLNKGYYKAVANTGVVTLAYSNSLSGLSYNYYNQLGQLVATIAPEGVKKLLGSGINNYAAKENIPFITLYRYDNLGRVVKLTSGDQGATEIVFRIDGKMRFSQNAEQKLSGRYSYVNYDQAGRPVEGGEYQPDGSGIAFTSDMSLVSDMKNILESTAPGGGLTTGIKKNVIITLYDESDASHGQPGYSQDPFFLQGSVSMIKKYSSITNNAPNDALLVSAIWYSYDEEGKVTWQIQGLPVPGGGGMIYKTTDFTYDVIGRTVKRIFQKNNPAEIFVHYYEYDASTKNLTKVYTNTEDNDATKKLQAKYIYYLHGKLKRIELAGNLQGIDYTYTAQGDLKAINNSDKTQDPGGDGAANGFGADAYGMVLDYFTGDYANTRSGIATIKAVNASAMAADSYTGNIRDMTWYSEKPVAAGLPDDPQTYVYNYDDKYRLTQGTWGTGLNFGSNPATFTPTGINKETVLNPTSSLPAYDDNGNILNLQRTDGTGAQTDNFTYSYFPNTNKLQNITNGTGGVSTNYASYGYDATGQVIAENTGDPSRQKYILYDVTGKVLSVARDAAFTQLVVEYSYDVMGHRSMKKSYNASFQLAQVTYYFGDVVFTQAVSGGNTYGAIVPQEYQVDGGGGRLGIFYRQSNIYAYEMTDHQDNVRAVIAQSGSGYEVRMYSDYYPYGMVIRQYQSPEGYRYGYQGKYAEKDNETDWNAFELRMYDSRIAKWLSGDPKGQFNSPYTAMGNNPVNGTDPDGGWWEEWNNELKGRGWITNAGYNRMQGLIAGGYSPYYYWVGNHFTGHGVIGYFDFGKYTDYDQSNGGKPFEVWWTIYRRVPVYPANDDLFQTTRDGTMIAMYWERKSEISLGAQVSIKSPLVSFNAKIISINLWSENSESGTKGLIPHPTDWENYEITHKVSLGAGKGLASVSISAKYKLGQAGDNDEFKAEAKLLNLNAQLIYNDAADQIYKSFGIKVDAREKKTEGSFLLGYESSTTLKIDIVPNGDREAWLKRQ